jgi:hypothetical protein
MPSARPLKPGRRCRGRGRCDVADVAIRTLTRPADCSGRGWRGCAPAGQIPSIATPSSFTDPSDAAAAGLRDRYVRDRYVLDRALGRGGMATVYLTRDLKHDRLVALKVLLPAPRVSRATEEILRLQAHQGVRTRTEPVGPPAIVVSSMTAGRFATGCAWACASASRAAAGLRL